MVFWREFVLYFLKGSGGLFECEEEEAKGEGGEQIVVVKV